MSAPQTEPDLTFQWPAEKGFPLVLFVCVAGSMLAHTASFVLFQVVYPQRVTIPQPAPHVSLLTPTSPENIALLRWIESEDPALIASDNTVPPPSLAEVRYQPSFATLRTAPLGAPREKSQEVYFPPAVDRLAVTELPAAPAFATPATSSPTVVQFAGNLATRTLAQQPAWEAPRLVNAPVSPTVLLIGVDNHGEVRFQTLQQSSGESQLDAFASRYLRSVAFAPDKAPITWAHVTFAWGADAYADTPATDPHPPVAR